MAELAHVSAFFAQDLEANLFSLQRKQAKIMYKSLPFLPLDPAPDWRGLLDLSGKPLIFSLNHDGNDTYLSHRFARGLYVVKIRKGTHNEVHRVNIFY